MAKKTYKNKSRYPSSLSSKQNQMWHWWLFSWTKDFQSISIILDYAIFQNGSKHSMCARLKHISDRNDGLSFNFFFSFYCFRVYYFLINAIVNKDIVLTAPSFFIKFNSICEFMNLTRQTKCKKYYVRNGAQVIRPESAGIWIGHYDFNTLHIRDLDSK